MPLVPVVLLALAACAPVGPPSGIATRTEGKVPVSALLREVRLKVDLVPKGTHGRKVVRPMTPRYITIHSTQNFTADAEKHSLALKRGALRAPKRRGGNRIGYLIWHFTVDQGRAIQHLPTSEQGEHADFDGPGNRYSIGIEMCEERGSSIAATVERTAKLTAVLMKKHGIPVSRVVPHYHWPRRGAKPPNKDCPHFLLDNGRPGRKWRVFQEKVNFYYRRLE
ncbi:N-acetylmuramoyl-L-alanine amidase [Akkermansiaceae bacterium]|nr:N-acetylmuramoyl-L-alanine amidase [Akkermansiaceae bacterium]